MSHPSISESSSTGEAAAEGAVYGRRSVLLPTAEQSAAIDARAREEAGVPERVLMENAGRSAALVLERRFPRGRVVVVAGSGNNGGDALVLARTLRAWGRPAVVVAASERTPPASLAHDFDIEVGPWQTAAAAVASADVVVDGILGTGATGAPRAPASDIIAAIRAAGRPVFALDLPSGVDATTGRIEGEAIDAAVTVTFGAPKLGLMLHPARGRCGRLIAVEIGFPPATDADADAALITPEWAAAKLPRRPANAHKGTSGRLLVLAGGPGMAGAAAITADAARRAGAGLVRLVSPESNRTILQTAVPEATFLDRDLMASDDLDGMTAAVAGPGLGTEEAARRALSVVLAAGADMPVALDADALNVLARDAEMLKRAASRRPMVITPHPREMGRLLSCTTEEVVGDAIGAAREACTRFGCVVLLKGQPSVVASPGEPVLVNTAGSSDVAAGGMGDQLAGVIGAFLAAGLLPRDAAAAALYFSARAADLAAMGRSLGPRDVSAHLSRAFASPGADAPLDGLPFITFDQPPRW
jgi:NAD(P)H-hydrate epimerase